MLNKNKSLIVFLPLLLLIFLAVALWQGLKQNPHRIPSPFINRKAPHFSASLLNNPNKKINEQLLHGQVSLLNVFATWCMSCQVEHSILMDVNETHRVNIFGLNYKDGRANAQRWLRGNGNPYTAIIFDPLGKIAIDFGVYGTPETFVIDRDGVIRYKYVGPVSPEVWRDKLLPLIERLQSRG